MIRAIQDNVVLRFLPEETQTSGGILLPGNAKRNRRGIRRAEVMAVGPGRYDRGGLGGFIPTTVIAGQVVWCTELAGEDYALDLNVPRQNRDVEFADDRGRFRIVREDEILAVEEDAEAAE